MSRTSLILIGLVTICSAILAQDDPGRDLWKRVKIALTAPDGEEYFNTIAKNALLPSPLRGSLISAKLNDDESRLVLGLYEEKTPEVTIIVNHRGWTIKKPLPDGSVIEFVGVLMSFIKQPFMVTIETRDKDDIKRGLHFVRTPAKN